jgi:transcriptional regulator with XRE-family HTH domain
MNQMTKTTPAGFVDGTNRIEQLLSDAGRAKRVAKIRQAGREMDRAYALNLAMIRKAAELTQDELAEKLGIGQGDVSKLEHRGDVLLSSLLNYLSAAGAEDARIVVTVRGQEIDLDLANLGGAPTKKPPRGAPTARAKSSRVTGKAAGPPASSSRVRKTTPSSKSAVAETRTRTTGRTRAAG